MKQDNLVTVICAVYNHEKYIKETLEGFVNQKTNFKVKYVIHDDCSIDHSKDIILEYQKKYPELIYPFFEKENQYTLDKNYMYKFIDKTVDSKYIAFCEGDDYWIDVYKLQKQIDYMEKNSMCTLTLTNRF